MTGGPRWWDVVAAVGRSGRWPDRSPRGWDKQTTRGEPALAREISRRNLYSVGPAGSGHEAIIRFGGNAPRRRAHSNERFKDHVPARVTTTSDRERPAGRRNVAGLVRNSCLALWPAWRVRLCRSATPRGTSPVVTMRQSAMSSLRASTTIIFVLRAPLAPSVRSRNHRTSSLFF